MYVTPVMTPRLLCHLHCVILGMNSGDLSCDSPFVKLFQSWRESEGADNDGDYLR